MRRSLGLDHAETLTAETNLAMFLSRSGLKDEVRLVLYVGTVATCVDV
jgi:hypothetical protein